MVGHEMDLCLDALKKLDRFFEVQLPDVIRTTIVVDNSLPRSELQVLPGNVTVIGGDSSFREFSAWDRGLAQLDRMRESVDLVHLSTITFDTLYTEYLNCFDAPLLEAVASAEAAVGHVDYYDDPVGILGRESQHWIRTCFFFLPPSAILALRSMVSFEQAEALFSNDPAKPFREDAPVSHRFQEYILSWLTGEGTGQGVTWHSRFDLSAETLAHFQQKAMAIINEHLLSIRLREIGHPLVDVTWLSSQLSSLQAEEIGWNRSWRDQVAERWS